MDPFNIIIELEERKLDLNIHPQEAGSYKIIYHGGLIGEIFMGREGENWEAVSIEDLDPGGYPAYQYDESSGQANVVLDDNIAQKIGKEIIRSQL